MVNSKEWEERVVSQQLLDVVLSIHTFQIQVKFPDVCWDSLSASSIRHMQNWITSDREVSLLYTSYCIG